VVPLLTTAERTQVCAVADLEPGEKRLVQGGRREVLLCRGRDGAFYAVGNICPHQGATLANGTLDGTSVADGVGHYAYGLDGQVLRCPWHGWEFDIKTGWALFGRESARIATYAVTVEDDAVFVADKPTKHKQTSELEEQR
jgi:nitrite reductase (NADH) small subunit